jgi:hypothetical protein
MLLALATSDTQDARAAVGLGLRSKMWARENRKRVLITEFIRPFDVFSLIRVLLHDDACKGRSPSDGCVSWHVIRARPQIHMT